jgi:hypothetical protein
MIEVLRWFREVSDWAERRWGLGTWVEVSWMNRSLHLKFLKVVDDKLRTWDFAETPMVLQSFRDVDQFVLHLQRNSENIVL